MQKNQENFGNRRCTSQKLIVIFKGLEIRKIQNFIIQNESKILKILN